MRSAQVRLQTNQIVQKASTKHILCFVGARLFIAWRRIGLPAAEGANY